VTVTFLTLAFAQLWHVFNMRHATSGLFHNEITRNPWVWAAFALCAGILITAAYVPSLLHMLHMAAPNIKMWGIVLAMSLTPLFTGIFVRAIVRR
jgi:Ca2+-transporting ATPase